MRGVSKQTEEEIAVIKKVSNYGKRRQQARKFDRYNRGKTLDMIFFSNMYYNQVELVISWKTHKYVSR
jgi:hypothetical protein